MNISGSIVFFIFLLLSCSENENKVREGNHVSSGTRKKVIESAINYAREQFQDANRSVLDNGFIRIGDDQVYYLIDPAEILTGLIDDDPNEDAIVTITSYRGNFLIKTIHLILIKIDGKFVIRKEIEENMKIIKISDGIIFAEISTYPPDSPSYNCQVCKEIVKYRFSKGNLIKAQ